VQAVTIHSKWSAASIKSSRSFNWLAGQLLNDAWTLWVAGLTLWVVLRPPSASTRPSHVAHVVRNYFHRRDPPAHEYASDRRALCECTTADGYTPTRGGAAAAIKRLRGQQQQQQQQ